MKARSVEFLLAGLLAFGACSCRLVTELMHLDPPRVLSCVPCSEMPSLSSLEEVRIQFSQPMNMTRTEEAFRLLENDAACGGGYAWEGACLRFRPFAGFQENKTYLMSVSTSAEDSYGNSLAEEFSFRFFTGRERIPPEIAGHSPAEAEVVTDLRRVLRLTFSESVDPGSLYRGFSISPRVAGAWSWNAEASEALYFPLESYRPGEEYRVEVDTSLEDTCGNRLVESFIFRFSVQGAPEQEILSLATGDGRIVLQPADLLPLNPGFEKDDCLAVQLRAPVGPAQTAGFIAVQPAVPWQAVWSDDFTACTVRFNEPLQWEGIYELGLLEQVYRLQVTGAASRPPAVRRVTFCNDTGAPLFRELVLNQNLTVTDAGSACFDFYIEHAAGFAVDLGSFLSALSVEGGECLAITQLSVARNPLPPEHAAPDPPADADIDVLRVYCRLEDAANPPGVIRLGLDENLEDTNRNHLLQSFLLMVNKL
jgi:hypothetical protein